MNLLCRLGLHATEWRPAQRTDPTTWLQIRKCRRCHHYLSQPNR